jgi:hypothetical protein
MPTTAAVAPRVLEVANGGFGPSPDNSLFCQDIFLAEWLATWLQDRLETPQIAQDIVPGQQALFTDADSGSWR